MATFTFEQYLGYSKKLQKELEKAYPINVNKVMAKSFQRRVRDRAPQGGTGSLKRIKLNLPNNRTIEVIGPEHWYYVDQGLAPNFPIPVQAIELHYGNPGATAGKKLKQFISPSDITGWFIPSQTNIPGKGFVTGSIARIQQDAAKIIEREFVKLAKR